jgi:hypothetical protein
MGSNVKLRNEIKRITQFPLLQLDDLSGKPFEIFSWSSRHQLSLLQLIRCYRVYLR